MPIPKPLTLWLITLLLAISLSPPAFADIGIDWLTQQAQSEGNYSTPNNIATPFMETVETLQTFYKLGEITQPSITNALEFINNTPFPSTEILSQKLIIQALAGQYPNSLHTELISRMGEGLGDLENYDSSIRDTAWALEALSRTETSDEIISPAIEYLLLQQQQNGGWADNDNQSSVYITAIVMHALWQSRHNFPNLNIALALNQAQTYLLSQKNNNGLWNETFETALALIAILPRLTAPDEISDSIQALRAAQLINGSWENDVYSTALALRALNIADSSQPNPDLGQITASVIDAQTGLALSGITVELSGTSTSTQTSNSSGQFSFKGLEAGNYTIKIASLTAETELKLGQIIDLAQIRIIKNLDATSIQGTVTSAITGEPLAGVSIEVTGVNDTILSDNQGAFVVTHIEPGEVTIKANLEGYLSASTTITLAASSSLMISIPLSQNQTILEGFVNNQEANPIVSALIFVDGTKMADTNAEGYYQINGLTGGQHNISVEHQAYNSVNGSVTMPINTTVTFSPILYPIGTTPPISNTANVIGKVIDKATKLPIPGITITNGTETTITNAAGEFNLSNLAAGESTLQFSLIGYLNKTQAVSLSPFTQLVLGEIVLTPENYKIPVGVKGLVIDASTNQALENVNIVVTIAGNEQNGTSLVDGKFEFNGEVADNLVGKLSFTIEGYVSYTLDVILMEDEVLDLGQVRLRPSEATVLLPDLVVKQLDSSGVQTDPQTLVVSGNIRAEIENAGTAVTLGNTKLMAFYDVDLNGVYGDGDLSLGEAVLENALAVKETVMVEIGLSGELPFRDAPIHVWVDNVQAVVESDEGNNVRSTANLCSVEPPPAGELKLQQKWHWKEGGVLGPPVVGQLTDDNSDGFIDNNDTPDLVFVSNNYSSHTLNAINGEDGSEIWHLVNSGTRCGSTALGDIDNDGIVEIVVSNSNRTKLLAFEHDGNLKWSTNTTPYLDCPRDGITLADLDHDGSPEIIHGKRVYNSNGTLRWEGTYDHGGEVHYGILSIAADIDLDGRMEVVAGRTVYDINGKVVWRRSDIYSGAFNAIGNFDEDDFAEIVLVTNGRVYLLEHTGETKWGPIYLPGGGHGGPPTVADFDGDGEVEIGIAGARNYVVLETNGTIKWTSSTVDLSSNRTGSSLFDFEGDGRAEVLYADEKHFYIYDGTTGNVLVKIPNGGSASAAR